MLLLIAILVLVIGSAVYLVVGRGDLVMKQFAFASDTVPSMPLIDTQVPKQIATATFAMG